MYDIITKEELDAHVRYLWDAWESNDPDRILEVYTGGHGFGFRTRAPRDPYGDKPVYKVINDRWWAMVEENMEFFIFKADQIHTMCCGDFGLAWGYYHENFKEKGKEEVLYNGRFSQVFVRKDGTWAMLFYHRDQTPFDEQGNFIPPGAR